MLFLWLFVNWNVQCLVIISGERLVHTTVDLPTVIMITTEQYHLFLRIQTGADNLPRK
jgi:hypothetical protein